MPEPLDPSSQTNQERDDDFYVGYLPVSADQSRFNTMLVVFIMVWALGMGVVIVLPMRSPGIARWDTGAEQTWTGTLVAEPYPMLVLDPSENPAALLVVSMAKHGAHERLMPYFNHQVSISGYELVRDGRHIIELGAEDEAINSLSDDPVSNIPSGVVEKDEPVTLQGEIVDGKCYLGAMKPGDGAGHRACAMLCLRGGLPPMFVARSPDGEMLYYLLVIDGSTAVSQQVLGLVARPVQIEGHLATMHGIPILLTTTHGITPTRPRGYLSQAIP